MASDDEETETVVDYICSRCGYSRRSPDDVVQHIVSSHNGDGTVREHEREIQDWWTRLVEWIKS